MKAKKAVQGAIKSAIKIKPPVKVKQKIKKPVKAKEKKSFVCCPCCKRWPKDHDTEAAIELEEVIPVTELSPEMEKANGEGYTMMKSVFFPSIPSLLQDIWVYLELLISVAAFAIGILGLFPIKENIAFQYFYLILASIAMFMALLDAFIYFFQLGSCARAYRFIRKSLKKRHLNDDADEDEEEIPNKKCGMSPELQEKFNTWFELARNLINEFLVYPLLICDLFDFIDEGLSEAFLPDSDDSVGNTDFSFFVIGGFYLILAVYIMRIFMVFGTLISLIRLPNNKKASGSDKGIGLIIKFCIHIIGQIVVHFVIMIVLAAKIHNENSLPQIYFNDTSTDMVQNITTNTSVEVPDARVSIIASPFLILSIVMGGLLPFAGVATFFIVNYYWMREFSIGFWLNMLSLLQGPSFAETVFGGDGLTSAKEQADQFLDDSGYDTVKSQIGRLKAAPWLTKFFYPNRVPLVALFGLLYDVCLVIFVGSLMLTYKNNVVQIVVFRGDDVMSVCFVLAVIVIVIANLHVLLLLNFLLLVMLLIGIAFCMVSFSAVLILLFVYLPAVGLVGYLLLFQDCKGKCSRGKTFDPAVKSDLMLTNDSVIAETYEMKKQDEIQIDALDSFNSKDAEVALESVYMSSGNNEASDSSQTVLVNVGASLV